MKKLLVTGGAGFIGSNFVHYWVKKYQADKIVILDMLTYAGNIKNLDSLQGSKNFTFVHGNICDQSLVEKLLVENQIDTIVHFAAESHVDRSIIAPDTFIETNIMGTYSLLKAAKKIWLDNENPIQDHRFHHVSTDEVYGTLSPHEKPFIESTAYAPNSPYSASKASSDHLVRAYHHTFGLNATISSCSNNYGPFHFPEKLIPLVITNILNDKELPIYGDGQQIRDWLYVEDHAYGIDLVLKDGRIGENYNIGGNNEWTNIDIVETIIKLIELEFTKKSFLAERFPLAKSVINNNARSLIKYVKDRPGHDRRYAINASKISNELGYKPKENFDTGIAKTVEWYLNNELWWKSIMDGSYQK